MAEEVFENFLQVPTNVRMRMIDKMEPDDRCRMTRCSKSCNQEAKSSKNYFVQLELHKHTENSLSIQVLHGDDRSYGYFLTFSESSGTKQVACYTMRNRLVSTVGLRRSIDLVQYVFERFRKALRDYQGKIKHLLLAFSGSTNTEVWRNVDFEVESLENLEDLSVFAPVDAQQFLSKIQHPLKKLSIKEKWNTPIPANYEHRVFLGGVLPSTIKVWRNVDFEVESLENLEDLSVFAPVDAQQFLSKIQHPLKILSIKEKWNTPIPANYEHIYQVESLSWLSVTLDYQQLLRLSANMIIINIGQLTERDIFKFIRSWQNGTLGREITFYSWYLRGSNFDTQKLLRLLRIADQEEMDIEIKHFDIPGKCAELRQTPFSVILSCDT